MTDDLNPEIAAEQAYVDDLFRRLDDEVTRANERLEVVQSEVDPANPDNVDALMRRETEYHALNAKLDRLNIAQLGLVFGRIDIEPGPDHPSPENPVDGAPELDRRYIGRMGLDDRADHYRTLLLDWRAPMARPFYLATTAHPEGVRTRRHIRTRGRTVTGVDDEVLSGDAVVDDRGGVGSETALHRAMNEARTGRMKSIVETIQREQDEIIRDPNRGVMVVQGGPGTGKTAVALHRVAYLLYTYREQLASTGVLIIGPNPTFLDYISRVLPELGETGVVLTTIGGMFPGVTPTRSEPLLSREVKGSREMVTILTEVVKHHQRLPERPRTVRTGSIALSVDSGMVKSARTRARRSRRPHNQARGVFAEHLIDQLARQLAGRIGKDPLGGENLLSTADVDQLHDDLASEAAVQELIDELWPELEPTVLLDELLGDRDLIAVAAAGYDTDTQEALYRAPGSGWADSDAALLDELHVLVGERADEDASTAGENDAWRQELEDAEFAIDILSSSATTDDDDTEIFESETLQAADVIDAETLARRQEVRDVRSTAERARADHEWAYGHVIVDEAQELTPMEWRMVFRRSPARWMTLVGDTAQTSSPAGIDSWSAALEDFVGRRFRRHELTVNYRTPEEIMRLANQILEVIDPAATPAESIRSTGREITFLPAGTDPAALRFDDGLVEVIDAGNVAGCKGLEFDHVVIVDPGAIVAASPQGWQDLYVAVTRATQSLTVIGDLPEM